MFHLLAWLAFCSNQALWAEVRPDFQLVSTVGSTNIVQGRGVAVDGAGNMYLGAVFNNSMPLGNTNFTSRGENDVLIIKYNAAGSLLWAKQIGSVLDDDLTGLVAETNGNLYLTGTYRDTMTVDGVTLTNASQTNDFFVAKLDAEGNLKWATRGGGTSGDASGGIALDSQTNVIVVGGFHGPANFSGVTNLTSSQALFIAKYNSDGKLLWAKQDSAVYNVRGVAIGTADEIHVYTQTFGSNLLAGVPVSTVGGSDIVIAKYNSNGIGLWACQAGGPGTDTPWAMAIDNSNNVFVAGEYALTNNFGSTNLVSLGGSDAFLAKYDSNGSLLWAQSMGGASSDRATSLAADAHGDLYVAGYYGSGGMAFSTTNLPSSGGNDGFIAKFDSTGNLLWANRFGGSGNEFAKALVNDNKSSLWLAGAFSKTASFGGLFADSSTGTNAFVARLSVVERATAGASRAISPDMFGFNTTYFYGKWNSNAFLEKLVGLNAGTLRFPSGTGANYWDWTAGDKIPTNQLPPGFVGLAWKQMPLPIFINDPTNHYDYRTWVEQSGATPVWLLNMMTRDLPDQIAMLQHARALGLSINYLELANEIYSDQADYVFKYPGPSGSNTNTAAVKYGLDCARWIAALRAAFPDLTLNISVAGYTLGDQLASNPRQRNWNQEVVATISAAGQHADAISFHPYGGSGLGDTNMVYDTDAPKVFTQAFLNQVSYADLAPGARAAGLDFWFTEYNLWDAGPPIYGTWMHGLFASLKALKFLEEPRVRFAHNHAIFGNAQFHSIFDSTNGFAMGTNTAQPPLVQPMTLPYGLSACGENLQLLHHAARWATNAQPIIFSSPITTVRSSSTYYPALYGWVFSDGVQTQAVVLNLSDQTLAEDFSGIFPAGGTLASRSTTPATYVTGFPDQLSVAEGPFTNQVTFPPYSISLLQTLCLPQIKGLPQGRTVAEGDTVALYARAQGNPAPSCQWFRNGSPIPGATNDALWFTNVVPGMAATYSVTVSNTVGVTTSNAPLTVRRFGQPPYAPQLSVAPGNPGQVALAWNLVLDATGYNLRRAVTPDGPYLLLVSTTERTWLDTNVIAGQTYYYLLTATNSVGESWDSSIQGAISPIIVDNADPTGVTKSGSWTSSTSSGGFYGTNYLHDGNTGLTNSKSVRFSPVLPTSGTYEVHLRWTASTSRATNAPVDVNFEGGSATFLLNEQTNGGTWNLLGSFNFAAGSSGNVVVRNDGASSYAVADAVQFIPHLTLGSRPVLSMSAPMWTNKILNFSLQSLTAGNVEVLTSTNLTVPNSNWTSLGTLSNLSGPSLFQDPSTNVSRRFYRARVIP